MPSLVLLFQNKHGSWEETNIGLQEWRLFRRSARSVLEYKNGGRESVYHGFTYYLELRWQYLSLQEYILIMNVVSAIRNGRPARWVNYSDLTYLQFDILTEPDMWLDIDGDEIVEAQGEWFEKMPFEITFVVTRSVSGEYDSA